MNRMSVARCAGHVGALLVVLLVGCEHVEQDSGLTGPPSAVQLPAPGGGGTGGEEVVGSFDGMRSSIATDSRNQPHIVIDAPNSRVLYQYHKIGGVWGGMEVGRSSPGGKYDASRLYMPHVEIDPRDRMWVSCKFGTKDWGSMLGQGVWCYDSVASQMNVRRFFRFVDHTVGGKGYGNIALDPAFPDEGVLLATNGRYAVLDDQGNTIRTGVMNIGASGEKFRFRIAPRAGGRGVWHAAMSGFFAARKLPSTYQNSVRNAAGLGLVRWIANNFHPELGEDVWHPSIGIDSADPEMCYIGERLEDGLRVQVWTGDSMLFSTDGDALLNLDTTVTMDPTRFGPQFAPARGGGAYVAWSAGGWVKIAYITQDGAVTDLGGVGGIPYAVFGGQNPSICTDPSGRVHMVYLNGGVRYRLLTFG